MMSGPKAGRWWHAERSFRYGSGLGCTRHQRADCEYCRKRNDAAAEPHPTPAEIDALQDPDQQRRNCDTGADTGEVPSSKIAATSRAQPLQHERGSQHQHEGARGAADEPQIYEPCKAVDQSHRSCRDRANRKRPHHPAARTSGQTGRGGGEGTSEISGKVCPRYQPGLAFAEIEIFDHGRKDRRIDETPNANRACHRDETAERKRAHVNGRFVHAVLDSFNCRARVALGQTDFDGPRGGPTGRGRSTLRSRRAPWMWIKAKPSGLSMPPPIRTAIQYNTPFDR